MKMVHCNGWAPRDPKIMQEYKWAAPIPIISPFVVNRNGLYHNFHSYNAGEVARFYYDLTLL